MSSGCTEYSCVSTNRPSTAAATPPATTPISGEHQALSDDQAHQLAAIRAKRRADADLARALADPVGQQAVDADDRERQRGGGKHAGQPRQETAGRQLLIDQLAERLRA